jgi:predicted regulator of Ras-like GTPase activity (Roadblock/LC7/MglB family)
MNVDASRHGNFQIFANLPRSELDDFTVTGNSGNLLLWTVDVNGVIVALAQKLAPVKLKMPD